jgi:hypothetical protein
MLYIAYVESANYAGYGQHFVIKAETITEAETLLEAPAEDYFLEEDRDQLEEEGVDLDTITYASIRSLEEFNELHECWQFYLTPGQAEFYYKVNF